MIDALGFGFEAVDIHASQDKYDREAPNPTPYTLSR